MVRRDDGKSPGRTTGGSLNEEDYFTKMNEEALKKIKQVPEDKNDKDNKPT